MKDESCSSNSFTSQEGLQAGWEASVASFFWAQNLWLTWFRKSTFGVICLPRAHGFWTVSAYLLLDVRTPCVVFPNVYIGFLFESQMVLSSVFLGFFDWPWLACEEDYYSGEMDSPSDDRIGITHPSDIIYQWKECVSFNEWNSQGLSRWACLHPKALWAYMGISPDQPHSLFLRALLLHQQVGNLRLRPHPTAITDWEICSSFEGSFHYELISFRPQGEVFKRKNFNQWMISHSICAFSK